VRLAITGAFALTSMAAGANPFPGKEPGSNGLTFDAAGRLVLCRHGDRQIGRLEADGMISTVADRYDGHRINSPNDLVLKSNGGLHLTDPPFGLPKAFDVRRKQRSRVCIVSQRKGRSRA
jgi:gluconolactonase